MLAHPHKNHDLDELAKLLPDQLKQEDPKCQIIACKVILQGAHKRSKPSFAPTVVRFR